MVAIACPPVFPRTAPAHRRPSVSPATYRRRRAAAATAAVALGLAARAVVGGLGGGPLAAPVPSTVRSAAYAAPIVPVVAVTHVVQPGETLWTIARSLQPTGDVRGLVDRLARACGPGPLRAGQRIVLP